jgi:predicted TIM-barrel fold metal-dependent hydrolase
MRLWAIALMCSALWTSAVAQRVQRQPIIDVHKHASWPGTDDAAPRAALLAEMDAEGIVLSLLHINEPGDVQGWLEAAPGRFIGGPAMPCSQTREEPFYRCFAETKGWPDLTWLEHAMAAGKIGILGEMLFVYTGVHPDDTRMAPYWALAAKYDVPVAVHINRGPGPGQLSVRGQPLRGPAFNGEMGNPALLRPVLKRHPKLRILLQHVGTGGAPDLLPFNTEIEALLKDYSTVYFDMSILNSVAPAATHEAELKRLITAGFGDRIMFGSDTRPAAPILRRLENIAWLTEKQRRAILYDNAAQFLRLDAQTIARHHASIP